MEESSKLTQLALLLTSPPASGGKGLGARGVLAVIACIFLSTSPLAGQDRPPKLRVMIVDGQNNHDWRATSAYLRTMFEDSGRFEITEPATAPPNPNTPDGRRYADNPEQYELDMAVFRPWFERVDVIVLNYNGLPWPEKVQQAFEKSVEEGKGLVVI